MAEEQTKKDTELKMPITTVSSEGLIENVVIAPFVKNPWMGEAVLEQNQMKVVVFKVSFQWDKITQGKETEMLSYCRVC